MKRTIAAVLVALMTILCIGGGYSETDALSGGIEAEEIIPDQLPEPEQESEEDMATGDKLVNLDDLKVAYDKQQEDTNSLKSALNNGTLRKICEQVSCWARKTVSTSYTEAIGTTGRGYLASTTKLSTYPVVSIRQGVSTVKINSSEGYKHGAFVFDRNLTTVLDGIHWTTDEQTINVEGMGYIVVVLAKADDSTISMNEYSNCTIYTDSVDARLVTYDKLISSLDGKIDDTKQDLLNDIGDINTTIGNISSDLASAQEDITDISSGLSDAESDISDLSSDMATAKTDINNLKSDVSNAEIDIAAEEERSKSADNAFGIRITDAENTITGLQASVSSLGIYKVAQPLDGNNQPTNGTSGQALRTNGDGTTEWASIGLPTDEQTAQAVSDWLDNHPDATTTVQDGSITPAKFSTNFRKQVERSYDNVTDMVSDTTLISGQCVKTNGYYSINDGGGAFYIVRQAVSGDIYSANVDGTTSSDGLIRLSATESGNILVCELVKEPLLNICKLGAKKDGTADTSTIIQNALALSNRVYAPTGIYRLDNTVYIGKTKELTGDGARNYQENTLTVFVNNTEGFAFSSDGNTPTIHLEGFKIVCSNKSNSGIYLGDTNAGVYNSSFKNITVINADIGFHFNYTWNNIIEKLVCTSCDTGFLIGSLSGAGSSVFTSCLAYLCEYGWHFTIASDCTLINSGIDQCDRGFYIQGSGRTLTLITPHLERFTEYAINTIHSSMNLVVISPYVLHNNANHVFKIDDISTFTLINAVIGSTNVPVSGKIIETQHGDKITLLNCVLSGNTDDIKTSTSLNGTGSLGAVINNRLFNYKVAQNLVIPSNIASTTKAITSNIVYLSSNENNRRTFGLSNLTVSYFNDNARITFINVNTYQEGASADGVFTIDGNIISAGETFECIVKNGALQFLKQHQFS